MSEEKNNNRNTINYIITIINIVKQQVHKKNIFCVRLKNYLLLNWRAIFRKITKERTYMR